MIVWEDAIIPQLFKPVHAHKSEKLHYNRVTNHRSVEAEPPWRAGGREKRKRREEGSETGGHWRLSLPSGWRKPEHQQREDVYSTPHTV